MEHGAVVEGVLQAGRAGTVRSNRVVHESEFATEMDKHVIN